MTSAWWEVCHTQTVYAERVTFSAQTLAFARLIFDRLAIFALAVFALIRVGGGGRRLDADVIVVGAEGLQRLSLPRFASACW